MKVLDRHAAFAALCRATKSWGVYISFDDDAGYAEVLKAAPYLSFYEHIQVLSDGQAVILCKSREECDRIFGLTVSDEGPTKMNSYDGPVRVYAMTCGPDGELRTENT